MIIHLLSVADENEQEWLNAFLALGRSERSDDRVRTALKMMRDHGSIEFAREFSKGVSAAARESFEVAFDGVAPSEDLRFIEELIPYMLERES